MPPDYEEFTRQNDVIIGSPVLMQRSLQAAKDAGCFESYTAAWIRLLDLCTGYLSIGLGHKRIATIWADPKPHANRIHDWTFLIEEMELHVPPRAPDKVSTVLLAGGLVYNTEDNAFAVHAS